MTTRHPKGKQWTTRELATITPAWKGDVLNDGDGLIGEVRCSADATVSIPFRYGFKWEGKKKWHYVGSWPFIALAEIRTRRDKARLLLKQGINPADQKKAERIERQKAVEATLAQAATEAAERKTVQDLFDTWIIDGVARKDGNKELKRLFGKDILPAIGQIELRQLTDHDLLAMLRKVATYSDGRLTEVVYGGVSQMLRWGEKRQPWRGLLINGNPCHLVDVAKLIPADYDGERARVLSPSEIRELRNILTNLRSDYEAAPAGTKYSIARPLKRETELALWICLSTLSRIGELLMAEWKHVDLKTGTWFIPKENVKGRAKKKTDQYVFLSNFAKRQFVELKNLTGESRWLFPAKNTLGEETHVCANSVSKQIGDRQTKFKQRSKPLSRRRHDDTLVLAAGEKGEWTPHDLRRTGATMMQQLGVPLDIIDRCQNHVLPGKVRRHYLHHDYRTEKTEAWKKLGDQIDVILSEQQKAQSAVEMSGPGKKGN